MALELSAHLRGHSISDRPGGQRPFAPIEGIFNNSGIIGMVAQTALRLGVGSLSSFVVPTFDPAFAGALTFGTWLANAIGFVVNDELIQDVSDPWAVQAITKLALVAIQGFVCSYTFSMSITTFATYYLAAEVTNAAITGALGALQNTIDPMFLQ